MDLTPLVAWSSLLGLFVTGFFTLINKKTKAPEDKAVERRDTIADRDAWIDKLNARLDKVDARLEAAEAEIEEMRDHNNSLKAALYRVLSILREKGLLGLLQPGDIPPDIHY